MEPAHKTLTLTVPNGVLKKNHHHQQQHHQPQQQQVRAAVAVYRECLKNHAASLGGHAVDGCGEFMASPSSNPSDPTSLTCAACGCHRNFHRRIPLNPQLHHHPQPLSSEKQHNDEEEDDDNNNEGEDDGQDQEEDPDPDEIDDANDGETGENSSASHMLLALSAGVATQPQPQPQSDIHWRIIEQQMQQQNGNREAHQPPHPPPVPIISNNSRKRFRTKFSPEQKERMQDLSERLGWKMQKRDEGLVEERCREIGIGKGVFKVWMHNNKHNFLHSSSRSNFTTTGAAVSIPIATDGVAPSISTLAPAAAPMSDDSDGNGNPIGISVRVNGSASAVS